MIALHSQHSVWHACMLGQGNGKCRDALQPFLLPCRSQLLLAAVPVSSARGTEEPCTLCLSAPCTAEPELSAALWTIPRLFLFLLVTEFTHLLKTVSKIQRKLDFPLIRFYGNWIIFLQHFSVLFFSWEKISNRFCLFCCRGLTPRPYILCFPFE